jgi:myosin heavy subunit/CRP-like cAMP-binding protein
MIPARVVKSFEPGLSNGTVELENNEIMALTAEEGRVVTPMNPEALDPTISDLIKLKDLTDFALLHILRIRFDGDLIYTGVSSILISVNPFQPLPLYSQQMLDKYMDTPSSALQPHIYGTAKSAYIALLNTGVAQAVLIAGESGAGKTEATKQVLRYLTEASSRTDSGGAVMQLEQKLVQANPLTEAFGNAKTVRNDNSSRFGKLITVNFSGNGAAVGGSMISYMLEKARVVQQAGEERNYHIFYQLIAAVKDNERLRYDLALERAEAYNILNLGSLSPIQGVDDKEQFFETAAAASAMGIDAEAQQTVWQLLSGLLFLGNVEYTLTTKAGDDAAEIKDTPLLETAAAFLKVQPDLLAKVLCSHEVRGQNSVVYKLHTPLQAEQGRDTLVRVLYDHLFLWVVRQINVALGGGSTGSDEKSQLLKMHVLDIFGFECFETNSFEQLCINYCNEKLQAHFTYYVFELEQQHQKTEGLELPPCSYDSNADCLELFEHSRTGLFGMIQEELFLPQGSDEALGRKLERVHGQHPCVKIGKNFGASKVGGKSSNVVQFLFGVKHYAGVVEYNTAGFLDKSKDKIHEDMIHLLKHSGCTLVKALWESITSSLGMESAPSSGGRVGGRREASRRHSSSSQRNMSLGMQFKQQLGTLMTTLDATEPFFVRCVKSNGEKRARLFDARLVLEQLNSSGMLGVCKIRRQGFPVRMSYADFDKHFSCLVPARDLPPPQASSNKERFFRIGMNKTSAGAGSGPTERVQVLCQCLELQDVDDYAFGATQIFLKQNAASKLQERRISLTSTSHAAIARYGRGYVARQRYKKQRRLLMDLSVELQRPQPDTKAIVAQVVKCRGLLPYEGAHLAIVSDAEHLAEYYSAAGPLVKAVQDAFVALEQSESNSTKTLENALTALEVELQRHSSKAAQETKPQAKTTSRGLRCDYCDKKTSLHLFVDPNDSKHYCLKCWKEFYGAGPSADVEHFDEKKLGAWEAEQQQETVTGAAEEESLLSDADRVIVAEAKELLGTYKTATMALESAISMREGGAIEAALRKAKDRGINNSVTKKAQEVLDELAEEAAQSRQREEQARIQAEEQSKKEEEQAKVREKEEKLEEERRKQVALQRDEEEKKSMARLEYERMEKKMKEREERTKAQTEKLKAQEEANRREQERADKERREREEDEASRKAEDKKKPPKSKLGAFLAVNPGKAVAATKKEESTASKLASFAAESAAKGKSLKSSSISNSSSAKTTTTSETVEVGKPFVALEAVALKPVVKKKVEPPSQPASAPKAPNPEAKQLEAKLRVAMEKALVNGAEGLADTVGKLQSRWGSVRADPELLDEARELVSEIQGIERGLTAGMTLKDKDRVRRFVDEADRHKVRTRVVADARKMLDEKEGGAKASVAKARSGGTYVEALVEEMRVAESHGLNETNSAAYKMAKSLYESIMRSKKDMLVAIQAADANQLEAILKKAEGLGLDDTDAEYYDAQKALDALRKKERDAKRKAEEEARIEAEQIQLEEEQQRKEEERRQEEVRLAARPRCTSCMKQFDSDAEPPGEMCPTCCLKEQDRLAALPACTLCKDKFETEDDPPGKYCPPCQEEKDRKAVERKKKKADIEKKKKEEEDEKVAKKKKAAKAKAAKKKKAEDDVQAKKAKAKAKIDEEKMQKKVQLRAVLDSAMAPKAKAIDVDEALARLPEAEEWNVVPLGPDGKELEGWEKKLQGRGDQLANARAMLGDKVVPSKLSPGKGGVEGLVKKMEKWVNIKKGTPKEQEDKEARKRKWRGVVQFDLEDLPDSWADVLRHRAKVLSNLTAATEESGVTVATLRDAHKMLKDSDWLADSEVIVDIVKERWKPFNEIEHTAKGNGIDEKKLKAATASISAMKPKPKKQFAKGYEWLTFDKELMEWRAALVMRQGQLDLIRQACADPPPRVKAAVVMKAFTEYSMFKNWIVDAISSPLGKKLRTRYNLVKRISRAINEKDLPKSFMELAHQALKDVSTWLYEYDEWSAYLLDGGGGSGFNVKRGFHGLPFEVRRKKLQTIFKNCGVSWRKHVIHALEKLALLRHATSADENDLVTTEVVVEALTLAKELRKKAKAKNKGKSKSDADKMFKEFVDTLVARQGAIDAIQEAVALRGVQPDEIRQGAKALQGAKKWLLLPAKLGDVIKTRKNVVTQVESTIDDPRPSKALLEIMLAKAQTASWCAEAPAWVDALQNHDGSGLKKKADHGKLLGWQQKAIKRKTLGAERVFASMLMTKRTGGSAIGRLDASIERLGHSSKLAFALKIVSRIRIYTSLKRSCTATSAEDKAGTVEAGMLLVAGEELERMDEELAAPAKPRVSKSGKKLKPKKKKGTEETSELTELLEDGWMPLLRERLRLGLLLKAAVERYGVAAEEVENATEVTAKEVLWLKEGTDWTAEVAKRVNIITAIKGVLESSSSVSEQRMRIAGEKLEKEASWLREAGEWRERWRELRAGGGKEKTSFTKVSAGEKPTIRPRANSGAKDKSKGWAIAEESWTQVTGKLAEHVPLFQMIASRNPPMNERSLTMVRRKVLEKMQEKRVLEAGDILAKQGAAANELCVVLAGDVEVLDGTGSKADVVGHLRAGDFFGEQALVQSSSGRKGYTNGFRVKASCDRCELAVLSTVAYQQLLQQDVQLLCAIAPWSMVANVPLFVGAPMNLREALVARVRLEKKPGHTEVMEQGECVDRLYFVVLGECRVQVDGLSKKRLRPGDWFAESALLPHDDSEDEDEEDEEGITANATVKTLNECDFVVLTRADCLAVQDEFPQLQSILEMAAIDYE